MSPSWLQFFTPEYLVWYAIVFVVSIFVGYFTSWLINRR